MTNTLPMLESVAAAVVASTLLACSSPNDPTGSGGSASTTGSTTTAASGPGAGGMGGAGGSYVPPDVDPPHLPYDPGGWTMFPTNYTVTIYVDSAAGLDTNTGTTPDAPIKSLTQLSKVITARTAGQSMRVELKRGGDWSGQRLTFSQGGDVADHPLLIEGWSYGDSAAPRPVVGSILMWKPSPIGLNHIAIAGIYFGPGGGVNTGINYSPAMDGGDDLLLEDDVVDGFFQNIIVVGTSSAAPLIDFKMRRCQTINSYDVNYATVSESKPQGVYAYALKNALFEENLFDHNAYHYDDLRDATEFGHDLYISNATAGFSFDVELRGNLISRGLHAVKGPATGTIDDNLLYDDGFGGYIGSEGGNFVDNVVYNNNPKKVFGYNIATSQPSITQQGGFAIDGGMSLGMANALTTVSRNLFGHGSASAFSLGGGVDAKLAFSGNVIADWQECLGSYDSSTLQITDNQCQGGKSFKDVYAFHTLVTANSMFSGNTYYGSGGTGAKYFVINGTGLTFDEFTAQDGETGAMFQQITYPDEGVDLAPYLAQLPGTPYGTSPTIATFITAIETQSKFNWQRALRIPVINNYLRSGFSVAALKVPYASGN